jgi:hypothetical protein
MKRRLLLSQLDAEIKKAWGSCTSIKPSSWSSLTPLTTQQEARIYKVIAGEVQIQNYIFEYIHEDLRWLIWKHPLSASKLSRPNRYPLSLFFRSNFYKQFNWEANLSRSSRLSNLKAISDLNWNTAPLEWFLERRICTWPTCTQASTAGSFFALMWARMNRCSCIYDIRNFSKLSPIEKEMLSWLEKDVRPKLHATATFLGKVDTSIKRNTANGFLNGNCWCNAFISGEERILPTEDLDDIEKYVRWFDMTKAAEFDRPIIWKVQRDRLKNICRYVSSTGSSDEGEAKSPSNLKASSSSNKDDSKWDSFFLNGIVTETAEQGICLATTPTNSSLNARVALTIMGQATRLFVLQNKQVSQFVSKWSGMAMKLFPSSTNSIDGKVTQFINDVCSGGESIDIILFRRTLCSKTTGHY